MSNAFIRHAAAAIACAGALLATGAVAQEWAPTKAVRIIVPIVGGTNDIIARIVAPELQKVFGQPVVVENRGGAAATSARTWWRSPPPTATRCSSDTTGRSRSTSRSSRTCRTTR